MTTNPNRLAIMQPYFLPYIGYFALCASVDRFIFFDDVQYVRRGWINRNRISDKSCEDGWRYLTVPVLYSNRNTIIKEISISDDLIWREKMRKSIELKYKKFYNYEKILSILGPIFNNQCNNLSQLNIELILNICNYLDIKPIFQTSSSINYINSNLDTAENLILYICKEMGATDYWNLPGGKSLYSKDKFKRQNINLHFIRSIMDAEDKKNYPEFQYSILELLMVKSKDEIIDIINKLSDKN